MPPLPVREAWPRLGSEGDAGDVGVKGEVERGEEEGKLPGRDARCETRVDAAERYRSNVA